MQYLTVAQTAQKINRTPQVIRKHAISGNIPGAVKHGRDWMIPVDAIEMLANMPRGYHSHKDKK